MTDAHRMLHGCAGKWAVESKIWFGPGEPKTSKGSQDCRVILGGLGIAYEFTGEMMGSPFLGFGTTVYNPTTGKYDGVWQDNYNHNGASISTGTFDAKAKTMTDQMVSRDPKGNEVRHKTVTRFESDDKHVMTFFLLMGDKEQKIMELTYTRQK